MEIYLPNIELAGCFIVNTNTVS